MSVSRLLAVHESGHLLVDIRQDFLRQWSLVQDPDGAFRVVTVPRLEEWPAPTQFFTLTAGCVAELIWAGHDPETINVNSLMQHSICGEDDLVIIESLFATEAIYRHAADGLVGNVAKYLQSQDLEGTAEQMQRYMEAIQAGTAPSLYYQAGKPH